MFVFMALEGVRADKTTFMRALGACKEESHLTHGKSIHRQINSAGLESELILRNALVSMYGRCGSSELAKLVFDGIRHKSLVSWNAMISAYARNGQSQDAVELYEKLPLEPNEITVCAALGACSSGGDLEKGKRIHAGLSRLPDVETGVMVQTSLVNMYAKCGSLETARSLFEKMERKTVVSWNAMVAGCVQQGCNAEALLVYRRMSLEGMPPSSSTYACVLGACSSARSGEEIYSRAVHSGCDSEALQVAVVTLYGKFGALEEARRVFDRIQNKNVVLWTSMIGGYVQHSRSQEALETYHRMDVEPNQVTYATILSSCATLEQGKEIHQRILTSRIQPRVALSTALVKMFAGFGDLLSARKLFDELVRRRETDVVAWNAMIGGYVQNGLGQEGLKLYTSMEFEPDRITLVAVLGACSLLGDLTEGEEVHRVVTERKLELDAVLGSALVNMYAKCGAVETARSLFERVCWRRNAVLWNTMLAALAQHGDSEETLALFRRMAVEGIEPDSTTFLCLLLACSHGGLTEKGRVCFTSLLSDYPLGPRLEHYLCFVDVLGRSGGVESAQEVVDGMPFQPELVAWRTLLSSCRISQRDMKRSSSTNV